MTARPEPLRKRAFDVVVGATALIVLLPVAGLVALLVRVGLGTPVIFRNRRPGLAGQPFDMYKFRTMTEARDASGLLLPDKERLTPLGRLLRATSLDEIPELVNVLKGDMSLVGPRPLLMHYLPYFTEREALRHAVKPGISGWAQVHGRNLLPWDDRLALDVWYVEHWSLALDIRILAATVLHVIAMRGAEPDTETVETDLSQERAMIGARRHD
jgi:lipopolysaccharide/colanic/teichoic acid biosynthesis glycosyltransferase